MNYSVEDFCDWYVVFSPYPQLDKELMRRCDKYLNNDEPFPLSSQSIFKASMLLAYSLEWPVMDVYKNMKFYFGGTNYEIK